MHWHANMCRRVLVLQEPLFSIELFHNTKAGMRILNVEPHLRLWSVSAAHKGARVRTEHHLLFAENNVE